MSGRDYQRSKVYAWERETIAPRGGAPIAYARAQSLISGVWMAEGLVNPPTVVAMPRQNRRAWSKANRLHVWVRPDTPTPTWVLLHEIAHSLSGDLTGETDGHGPHYLGLYMKLVDRHLKIPLPLLMFTANRAGLQFDIGARPSFLDPTPG